MKNKTKNQLVFLSLSLALGAVVATVIWVFFHLMNFAIDLLWTTLPEKTGITFLPMIIAVIGGLIIGLFRKQFGDYPETMDSVMQKIKEEGAYPYHNIHIIFIAALLPIIFGASIGPEAGIAGVIVGLCYFVGDRLKYAGVELKELTQIGISASLGVIFNAPMFGFMMPLEPADDNKEIVFPKRSKIFVYFVAILGGLIAFNLLGKLFPTSGGGMPHFTKAIVSTNEQLLAVPIAIVCGFLGTLFIGAEKLWRNIFKPLKTYPVVSAVIGGFVIGLFGMFLPLVLFSGEHQLEILMEQNQTMTFAMLFGVGILKLILTPFCIECGWKGGHIFPVIFAGVAIGYAVSIILPVDPTFAVTIATASVTGSIMRQPLVVALLLILCFPPSAIIWMFIAAFVGSKIPLLKIFRL